MLLSIAAAKKTGCESFAEYFRIFFGKTIDYCNDKFYYTECGIK